MDGRRRRTAFLVSLILLVALPGCEEDSSPRAGDSLQVAVGGEISSPMALDQKVVVAVDSIKNIGQSPVVLESIEPTIKPRTETVALISAVRLATASSGGGSWTPGDGEQCPPLELFDPVGYELRPDETVLIATTIETRQNPGRFVISSNEVAYRVGDEKFEQTSTFVIELRVKGDRSRRSRPPCRDIQVAATP
jgi:hypothetical protein